jgi:hypothetical protein
MADFESILVRPATHADADELARLAEIDSTEPPSGRVLLGLVGGELLAALALPSGRAIADPFRPTARLVELLRYAATAEMGAARL